MLFRDIISFQIKENKKMWIDTVEANDYVGTSKVAEDVVEEALVEEGMQKRDMPSLVKGSGYRNKTELVQAVQDGEYQLEPNTYYSQPLGSQMSPDFIAVTDEVFFIEVKASKKPSGYQFNSHLINNDFMYVLSDPSVGFKVVPGAELMSPEVREKLYECHQKCAEYQRECNEEILALPSNTQNWNYYARSMYTQRNVYA